MRTEPRWPATIAVLALAGLYLMLPEHLTLGPSWIGSAAMLLVAAITMTTHRIGRHEWNRFFSFVLLGVITFVLAWAFSMLIAGLPSKRDTPTELLRSATALWVSNVLVFASWYWRLDAGGPHSRDLRDEHTDGAFLFPQMTLQTDAARSWKPGFVDYLFLAFSTSTAFSPTDVPVLSRWAKLLMMVQSSLSLGTLVILAARAVNIL